MSVIPEPFKLQPHYRGSTFAPITITFNFDITGATILSQIRQSAKWPVIHEWKTDVNIDVIDPLIGKITLNKINKFAPPAMTYVMDVQIDFADGTSETFLRDNLVVFQDISETL